jgi:hypothetical protein
MNVIISYGSIICNINNNINGVIMKYHQYHQLMGNINNGNNGNGGEINNVNNMAISKAVSIMA